MHVSLSGVQGCKLRFSQPRSLTWDPRHQVSPGDDSKKTAQSSFRPLTSGGQHLLMVQSWPIIDWHACCQDAMGKQINFNCLLWAQMIGLHRGGRNIISKRSNMLMSTLRSYKQSTNLSDYILSIGPQLNLTTFSIGITTDWKYILGGRTLWVVARCSNDLAAAHYRLAHAVLMVGLYKNASVITHVTAHFHDYIYLYIYNRG